MGDAGGLCRLVKGAASDGTSVAKCGAQCVRLGHEVRQFGWSQFRRSMFLPRFHKLSLEFGTQLRVIKVVLEPVTSLKVLLSTKPNPASALIYLARSFPGGRLPTRWRGRAPRAGLQLSPQTLGACDIDYPLGCLITDQNKSVIPPKILTVFCLK